MDDKKIDWLAVGKRLATVVWIAVKATAKAVAWLAKHTFNACIAVIAALATAFVAVSQAAESIEETDTYQPDEINEYGNAKCDYFASEGELGVSGDGTVSYSGSARQRI